MPPDKDHLLTNSIGFRPVPPAGAMEVLRRHLGSLPSPIDSFLEAHILTSRHYHILRNEQVIGWTAVHEESLLTQFGLFAPYRRLGQRVFQEARKLEAVRMAFVPTCDEFFLAHALDDYRQLEKQAYFFQHEPAGEPDNPSLLLEHRPATPADVTTIQELSGTFFDRVEQRVEDGQLFITQKGDDCVGFGIIEESMLLEKVASIGMFTVEQHRRQGVGTALIRFLIAWCVARGLRPIAGCWYYNHLSKKTLEKAGMFSPTRLLKVSY